MKKEIMPIMVSTMDALRLAAGEGWPVIHVHRSLYDQAPAQIRRLLAEQGYILSARPGKQGVFFLLYMGEDRFRHQLHEIRDPQDIL